MPSCAVQGCKSGYSTNPEKVHFFSVPKKELTEWRIALNRDDLSAGRAVCEKHFRTQEIDWKERVAIIRNGQVFGKTSLKIPRRKKGVVPSIFPWTEDWDSQQPKDLVASHRRSVIDIGEAIDEGLGSDNSFPRPDNDASNAVPIHENQENLESPLDIPSTSNFSDSENLGSSENACASPCCSNEAADSVSSRENVDNLTPSINFNEMARTSFKLPEGWLQEVKSTNDGNVLNFFVTKIIENKDSLNGPNLVIPVIWKAILIKSNLIPQCYVLHQPWDYVDRAPIRHIEEIQNLINTIDGLNVCTGPLLHDEFDQSKCSILHKDITGIWRHNKCTFLIDKLNKNKACNSCQRIKNTLRQQLRRVKMSGDPQRIRIVVSPKNKKDLAKLREKVHTARKATNRAHEKISKLGKKLKAL